MLTNVTPNPESREGQEELVDGVDNRQTESTQTDTPASVTQLPLADSDLAQVAELDCISRVNLKTFLIGQEGKFVGLDFIKNNMVERSLNGRLGVVYPLKGGENKSESLSNSYLTIFDVKAGGYRNVNLDKVMRVRAQHKVYDVYDVDGKTIHA